MESIITTCCQNLDTCNLANPIFIKDVFDPSYSIAPAITTLVLSLVYLVLAITALSNFRKMIKAETYVESRIPILMNLFVGLSTALWFFYALDGPIQLFSRFSGFPPYGIASFQIYAICLFHLCLIFSSYTWVSLILLYKDCSKFFSFLLKMFLILDVLFIAGIFIGTIVYEIKEIENGVDKANFLLSASAFVNGIFFSLCCFLLASNLKEIYYFDIQQQSKVFVLQVYAILIGLFTLLRSYQDIMSFRNPTWQITFKVTSFCDTGFEWSAYLLGFSLLANILPAVLFLTMFAPSVRQKGEDSFVRSYSAYMASEDEEESDDFGKKSKKKSYRY